MKLLMVYDLFSLERDDQLDFPICMVHGWNCPIWKSRSINTDIVRNHTIMARLSEFLMEGTPQVSALAMMIHWSIRRVYKETAAVKRSANANGTVKNETNHLYISTLTLTEICMISATPASILEILLSYGPDPMPELKIEEPTLSMNFLWWMICRSEACDNRNNPGTLGKRVECRLTSRRG